MKAFTGEKIIANNAEISKRFALLEIDYGVARFIHGGSGNGLEIPNQFSTTAKDTKDHITALSLFLQSIGRSRLDACAVCVAVEAGGAVSGDFGNK